MLDSFNSIIEDTANRFWAVRAAPVQELAHCYYGIEVKRTKAGFAPKAKARETLVRRACTRHVCDLHL